MQRLRDITNMNVDSKESSEDEESHSGQEEESDPETEDGQDTGSQASEGSPPAKTGAGPRGSRARRWFPLAQCSGWEEAQLQMHKLSVQQMSGAALHKGTVSATQGFLPMLLHRRLPQNNHSIMQTMLALLKWIPTFNTLIMQDLTAKDLICFLSWKRRPRMKCGRGLPVKFSTG